MPLKSARLNQLPPYPFAVLAERLRELQKQGADIIRLDIGNPDMPPPLDVIEVMVQSSQNSDNHGYSGYTGIPVFRQAVATYYEQRFGVHIDPDKEVLPVLGSKEGIVNLSMAYLDKGDIALVPDISYPSYAMGAYLANADVFWLNCDTANNFRPSLENIPDDILKRAKILWVNYPNNPTGEVVDLPYYQTVIDFCQKNDILLASDNPYAEVTFDSFIAPSPLQLAGSKDHVVEFISLSKSHNMAGWRLGAMVGNTVAVKHLLNVKSNVDSGHFIPIYEAGAHALNHTPQSWIDERNKAYARRRNKIMANLAQIGLEAKNPKGTLYIWAKPIDMTARDYVEQALLNAHVSFAHGSTYGSGGENYLRISIGMADNRIDAAIERLVHWYSKR